MNSKKGLQQLPNIGKILAEKLIQVGISAPEELYATGTERTYIMLREIDETACFSELQAIEGAIQGIRWHNLPKERKEELKEFMRLRRI
jgi:DNA transformation protein and related proteins